MYFFPIFLSLLGKVIVGDYRDDATFRIVQKARKEVVLHGRDIVAIPQVVCAPTLLSGVGSLLQLAGFGKLKPNTVLLGFKETYKESTDSDVHQYVTIIATCFITHHSVCVFRNQHVPLKYRPETEMVESGKHFSLILFRFLTFVRWWSHRCLVAD